MKQCKLWFGGAFGLGLIILANLALAEDKPALITIGYLNLVNAQLISKHMGWHEKALGVPIKWVKFDSGGAVNTAIAGGSIDFGGVGNPPSAVGVSKGLPYEGIFVLNMLGAVESLVARTDKNIKSVKDLVGKKVAVPFGSTTHYLLMAELKKEAVDPRSVTIIDMGPVDALAAWLRNDIDAAYIWEPSLDKIVKSGGTIILTSAQMAKAGYPTWDVAVVRKDFAKKYPTLVNKFVKTEAKAVEFWLKDPQQSAEIIAEELALPKEDITRMITGTTMVAAKQQLGPTYLGTSNKKGGFVDTLYSTAQFLAEQKRIPAVPDKALYDAFINPAYLEAAVMQKQ
ncbi:MAG: aliphatic sulfonate ABC transporter substrate-binding protein [Gammaproteobacteria bacterium]|nr:aliphatic sulfonate ABC transporter substrate-binding protein [Gammaproteobacteria bacterium]